MPSVPVSVHDDDVTIPSEPNVQSLDGAEHALVGLAPQFWAYTPMMIGTLQKLDLVSGLHCFFASAGTGLRFIPVSKCALLGIIVNVDRLYNGACLYLLDDGSGFVDCVAWGNDDNNLYSLPALVPSSSGDHNTKFRVGDVVCVFGRIQCVSIGEVRETRSLSAVMWEIRDCIREVHVSHIQKISADERLSWNAEADHWLASLQFQERLKEPVPSQLDTDSCDNSETTRFIRNGVDVLELMGPEIAQQAKLQDDFPSADDTLGAWRVFSTSCKCRLEYMDSLLYCHCQATFETLDPQFLFRDYLLNTLLTLRDLQTKSRGAGIPFCFQYKTIAGDERITRVAQLTVSQTEKAELNIQRLILRTFAALRTDGILHLMSDESDMYMLVCKECVMEPYIRTMVDNKAVEATYESKFSQEERPAYLAQVPNQRLQFVKRCLFARGGAATNKSRSPL